jgi:hypothetical protein
VIDDHLVVVVDVAVTVALLDDDRIVVTAIPIANHIVFMEHVDVAVAMTFATVTPATTGPTRTRDTARHGNLCFSMELGSKSAFAIHLLAWTGSTGPEQIGPAFNYVRNRP